MKKEPGLFYHQPPQKNMVAPAVILTLVLFMPVQALAQCELAVTANAQMQLLATADTSNINKYIRQEENFIKQDLTHTATYEILSRLEEFDVNIRGWLSDWWQNRLLPSMKEMTKQMSVAQVDQTRQIGSMTDAQLLNEAKKKKNEKQEEAHRRYAPSELSCHTDTNGPGQTKAYQMSRALTRGLALDNSKLQSNAKGSASATGRAAEMKTQWDEYVVKFCDNTKGDLGCTVPGTMPGKHKDVPGLLWGDKQSIDMSVEDNRIMVRAALRYLIYPASADTIPPGAVDSGGGHQAILTRHADLARTNSIYNVVGQMISERVSIPQDSLSSFFRKLRKLAGTPDPIISDNPSYSELRQAMTKDRFSDPAYIVRMVNSPEQVIREQGSINAIRLQLMNDLYRRNEEMLFMEAAAYSRDLDHQKPPSAITSAPMK
jgi:hypothetical protein